MKRKQNYRFNLPLLIVVLIAVVILGWVIYPQGAKQSITAQHISKDLKISLSYPKGWYIDDRDMNLLLTNYPSSLNKDLKPTQNQLELFVSNFSGCHPTIEENLKDPACGEGGSSVRPNEIIVKESRQTQGGTFYKYVIQSLSNAQFTFYLLENGDRVLQISKEPDPSKFEKEFEEIVNSIRFQ